MEQRTKPESAQAEPTTSAHPLIASDRVEGTEVRRPNGDYLGRIERIMIDKLTGRSAYAVMSFGGFLGFGEEHYPIPWSKLDYNPSLDAYQLDVTEDQLRNAPKGELETDWRDREWETRLHDYYRMQPYWGY